MAASKVVTLFLLMMNSSNPSLHFASLSLSASVDQQTGSLSVFNLLEEIRSPQLPIQIPTLVISLALAKSGPAAFDGKILIHFFNPEGKQQVLGSGELRIPPEQRRMKAVFRLGGFPINTFGAHRFVVSWVNDQGTKVGEALLDFDVIQVAQPPGQPGPTDAGKPPVTH